MPYAHLLRPCVLIAVLGLIALPDWFSVAARAADPGKEAAAAAAEPSAAKSGVAPSPEPDAKAQAAAKSEADAKAQAAAKAEAEASEALLLRNIRQLTFEGRRAGEGYYSRDGKQMVFQSEREPSNPFFQIYLLDFETGDVERVSPGHGKTTCAWIHPDGQNILLASTHADPAAKEKQQAELDLRAAGQQRRYSWDYDEHYDLYRYDRATRQMTPLTREVGYDAEGSYSPDGQWIAFASNRRAYTGDLTEAEKKLFELDPASAMDLYLMKADGTEVRRLTETVGYDGGPFFSPDGSRICWRRFAENGATAEIYSMNRDGSDVQQLTHLEAMSWAPFYHPSGEYLIFTTNLHGFANFELYLMDAAGKSRPVRVTHLDGFDGLPTFTPDGKQISWTSARTPSKQSQIFVAEWNHANARKLLALESRPAVAKDAAAPKPAMPDKGTDTAKATEPTVDITPAQAAAERVRSASVPTISPADVRRHVDYLCSEELAGRLTGTAGETLATAYVADYFARLGLQPAGSDGTFLQPFEFTAGVALGTANRLAFGDRVYKADEQWRPVAFSKIGPVPEAPVAFVGYGIVAPKADGQDEYDAYVHYDVAGKWVMMFRFMPEGIKPERRQHLARYASLRFKAMAARDKGAAGLIFVSGPNSQVRQQLLPLQFDGSLAGASIPVISVSDELADEWLKAAGKSLKEVQTALDTGAPAMGFDVPSVTLGGNIDIKQVTRRGRNVLARLQVGAEPSKETVIVGAHVDHLGREGGGSSLAREDEKGRIHYGADDNASGTAVMLEMAEYLADLKQRGQLPAGSRDLLFAAWSGEELGLLGSSHFVKNFPLPEKDGPKAGADPAADKAKKSEGKAAEADAAENAAEGNPHPPVAGDPHAGLFSSEPASLYPHLAACLNLDMVGRLDKSLVLQGIGSSSLWRAEIEQRNAVVGLPVTLQDDSYLPTDASSFYLRGVPILSAFTGTHEDYHTPRDTPDKLNYEGAAKVGQFMALVARSLSKRAEAPDYIAQARPKNEERRASLRAFLGTIPDYAESDVKGVKLSGVSKGGPADKAGVRGGDLVVELAGRKIENIYDYTFAIEALKIGQEVKLVVQRAGQRVEIAVTPSSRD